MAKLFRKSITCNSTRRYHFHRLPPSLTVAVFIMAIDGLIICYFPSFFLLLLLLCHLFVCNLHGRSPICVINSVSILPYRHQHCIVPVLRNTILYSHALVVVVVRICWQSDIRHTSQTKSFLQWIDNTDRKQWVAREQIVPRKNKTNDSHAPHHAIYETSKTVTVWC